MACNHEEIKSVNCVLFCLKCGAELPAGFYPGKHTPAPVKAAEAPENGQKTATKRTKKTAK